MLKKLLITSCLSAGLSLCVFAQQEENKVLETVKKVFDGMRKSDTTLFKSALHPQARFLSTVTQNGATIHKFDKIQDFVKAIATPHPDVWDERITGYDIRIDDGIAMVWLNYSFFVGDKFTHCGVDAVTLVNTDAGWKIIELADTRRIAPCIEHRGDETIKKNINKLMDNWHHAAAIADEDTFFGLMSKDAIYLGTDASERWLRDELKEWSKEFFAKDTAWAFTPKNREIYLHTSGDIAWFEEKLDTWMGECRGSGILTRQTDGNWILRHYNLAFLVPNDKMNSVIELMKKK